jgi:hypothetical protein
VLAGSPAQYDSSAGALLSWWTPAVSSVPTNWTTVMTATCACGQASITVNASPTLHGVCHCTTTKSAISAQLAEPRSFGLSRRFPKLGPCMSADMVAASQSSGESTGPRPVRRYVGSCHCGTVRFQVETDAAELTMCDCSICKRKNALMVKVHESQFKLLSGGDSLTMYQFHTNTAQHFFCKVCGIYPFHHKRVTPDHLGINVHCLEGFDATGVPVRLAAGAAMP